MKERCQTDVSASVFLSAEVKTFWLCSSYLWFNAAKTNTDLHPKRTQRPIFTSGKKRKTQTIKTLMINQKEFYLSFDCGRQTEVDVSRRAQTHTDRQTDLQGTNKLLQNISVGIFLVNRVSTFSSGSLL